MGFGDIEDFYETYQILNDTKVVACRTVNTVVNKWTNVQYTLTTLPLHPEYRFSKANQELGVLALCSSHANLVHLVDYYYEGNDVYIITEKLHCGSLRDYLLLNGPATEQFAAKIIKGIAEGLRHLHQYDIVHRNLKFENIYCCNDEKHPVKLSGFEMAVRNEEHLRENNDDMLSNFLTTPSYVAPEIASWFFKIKGFYSKQCDMWNLGAIMFEILAGAKPYSNSGSCSFCTNDSCYLCLSTIFAKIMEGRPDMPITWDYITSEGRDLISRLLENDPVRRYTPEKVLQHPWIKKYAKTFKENHICNDVSGAEMSCNIKDQSTIKAIALETTLDNIILTEGIQLDNTNDTFSSKYQLTKEILGTGMNGGIKTVVNKLTKRQYALKTIDVNDLKGIENAKVEIDILSLVFGHPNFVQMEDCYLEDSHISIVLEKLNHGSLFDRLGVDGLLEEKDTARVVRDIAVALKYLHQFDVAHRDVKLENIMCSSEDIFPVKLIDFGLASGASRKSCCDNHRNDIFNSIAGTPAYMAPEVAESYFRKDNHSTKLCDVWSLGVVLFEMLYGYLPFAPRGNCDCPYQNCDDCICSVFNSILKDNYTVSCESDYFVSEGAKDLLSKLLEKNPTKRYTADQVLNHPWVLEHV